MKNGIDYEFLIMEYLKSYNLYYGKDETLKLMNKILDKDDVTFSEKNLEEIGVEKLSNSLSNIILRDIRNKNMITNIDIVTSLNCTEDELASLVVKVINNRINQREEKEINSSNIGKKATCIAGIVFLIGLTVALDSKSAKKDNESEGPYKYEKYYTNNILEDENNMLTDEEYREILKANVEAYLSDKKICEPSDKFDTISDIFANQRYYEKTYKSDEDKLYPECDLSASLQQFIYKLSKINNIPTDFTFSIVHTETKGKFDSSGIISETNDLGLTQQNRNTYVKLFAQKYNISIKEAEQLVKDNDYANLVCCFMAYKEIARVNSEFDPIEYAGCYNGWIDWRDKSISRAYVYNFSEAYDNLYNKYHDLEKENVKKIK